MFITAFYGVIDHDIGELRYANAGHPHAFLVRADGSTVRLGALDPPLGMMVDSPLERRVPWKRGEDLLLLFTDGLSDARDALGARLGEPAVIEAVVQSREEPVETILERVFARIAEHEAGVPSLDDQTLVLLRT